MTSKLPEQLKLMLKTAETYNAKIQARKVDEELKNYMIVWLNVMNPKVKYKQNKKAALCLRRNHKIQTVGQLKSFTERVINQINKKCTSNKECIKIAKQMLMEIPQKWNPNESTPYKDGLDHTKEKTKQNRKVKQKGKNLYNPDITERQHPEKAMRIFTEKKITEEETQDKSIYRKHKKVKKEWTVYTDGSCKNTETDKAKAGIGIYCEIVKT